MRMNKILITAATLICLALPVSGQMSGRATDPAGSMAGGIENGQPGGMAVTIEECHGAAEKYFPLVRQYELTLSNLEINYKKGRVLHRERGGRAGRSGRYQDPAAENKTDR